MTTEQYAIRAMAREFAEGEIRPHVAAWDERRSLDEEIFRKLSELGFMGMRVPAPLGGLDLDTDTYLMVVEQLAWGDASVALSVAIQNGPVAHLLLGHASEELRSEILPRVASGELIVAFALSEPDAGSDAGGLETVATRMEDGWRLTGRKRWVTNGRRAGAAVVFARAVPGSQGGRGIGAFLVDTSEAGYRVAEREKTLGMRASETVEIELEEVHVPESRLIGDPSLGFRYAMEALTIGRLGIAAQAVGIAQAAFEHATAYAVEREQFGRSIADFGAIQEKLAVMAVRVAGARALTREAGRRLERGDGEEGSGNGLFSVSAGTVAAMAKLSASETAMWVAKEAVQIYGGYGYMRDYPVEKLMRDAKGTEIYEATSEILRMIIAKDYVRGFADAGE